MIRRSHVIASLGGGKGETGLTEDANDRGHLIDFAWSGTCRDRWRKNDATRASVPGD